MLDEIDDITMVHMVNSDTEFQSRSASASTPNLVPTDVKADIVDVSEASLTAQTKDSQSKNRADPKADAGTNKVTKRRAARACASCRARKVRCDVVEQYPCGNCRWDNVDCIVQESRRRRCEYFWPLDLLCPDALVEGLTKKMTAASFFT